MIRIAESSTIINRTIIVEYLCEPYFAIDTSIINIVHDIIILIARIKMSLRGTTNTARKQQQSRKRLKIKKGDNRDGVANEDLSSEATESKEEIKKDEETDDNLVTNESYHQIQKN